MYLQILVNSLISGSLYAAIAFGFTLIYGTMNFFNMAYGANVLIGAYTFYVLYTRCGIPLAISVVLACVITAALMLLVDRVCYYRFRHKRVPGWTAVVVSMAVATFFSAVIAIIFGSAKVTVYGKIPKSLAILPNVRITTIQLVSLAATVLLMLAMSLFLKKTKTGKMIRASSDDNTMAQVVGIDVERAYAAIIVVGSVLATVAGIMSAMDTDLRPTIASTSLLKAIVATCIGGAGNVKGAMIAAFVLGLIENIAVLYIGSGWRDAIPLVVVILVLVARPSVFGIEES